MWDEDSISCDRVLSPPSRHEKWKRAQQRTTGDFTLDVSRAVAEKIVVDSFVN